MVKLKDSPPVLVAHRGYSGRYPENTLLAYQAAYTYGARYMELDLQMTRDGVPVLHHDVSLKRMADVERDIWDVTVEEFKELPASYPASFGAEFDDNRFTTFEEFCRWLTLFPDVTVFVEIKQDSIDRFGMQVFMDEVYRRVLESNVEGQCVIISFNHQVIEYARKVSSMRIGWVLPVWSSHSKKILNKLVPDFMFCNKNYLPENDDDIWSGRWQWAIYNLDDVESAIKMANRGMPFLETNQIGLLLASKPFSQT